MLRNATRCRVHGKHCSSQNKEAVMYDMKNLEKFKLLEAHAPEAMKAFLVFDKAAWSDGAIPKKYKELIGVAVAMTTQCPYCIELHVERARKLDASDAESLKPSWLPRRCAQPAL